jgi:hypothetical protein
MSVEPMTPYSANPFIYIFGVVAIGAVFLYYIYGAIDGTALEITPAVATVVGKQFNERGRSYYTTITGSQAWVQSRNTPETYVVVLNVGSERTAGVVSKQLYESLQVNDTVQVKLRRTRITRRLEAVEVTK